MGARTNFRRKPVDIKWKPVNRILEPEQRPVGRIP
jgi:hypothetical protein